MTPRAGTTKEKLDFIKIKNLCASKNIVKKVKRQPKEWKKIFAHRVSEKSLVFTTYKELLQPSNKKTNAPIRKDLNSHFSKEDIQMAKST